MIKKAILDLTFVCFYDINIHWRLPDSQCWQVYLFHRTSVFLFLGNHSLAPTISCNLQSFVAVQNLTTHWNFPLLTKLIYFEATNIIGKEDNLWFLLGSSTFVMTSCHVDNIPSISNFNHSIKLNKINFDHFN